MDMIVIIIGFFLTILIAYNLIIFFIKNDIKNNKIPNYEEMINTLNVKLDGIEKKINNLEKKEND